MSRTLLEVSNLQTRFKLEKNTIHAVRGVSFAVAEGEVLGIVGESGSGKSVTALSLMRLIEPPGEITEGKAIFYDDDTEFDLLKLADKNLEKILGNRVSMIFQDPMTSLNPVLSIGYQIMETLRVHRRLSKKEAREQGINLLRRVGIAHPRQRFDDYPHQFSGGMRQRAMIAMAIACRPKLLIADEPTTALDVTIQAQILRLLRQFKTDFKMSLLIITHDLGVVAQIADRVAVMYAGRIVENASVKEIFARPQHPYTQALIASIPRLDEQPEILNTIEGAPPRFSGDEVGCSFQPRWAYRIAVCKEKRPNLLEIRPQQAVACFVAHEGAFANA
jgi:oligopeptide/dipeptide ABC transporter ATP-binding protein